jgi:hypothetical protein
MALTAQQLWAQDDSRQDSAEFEKEQASDVKKDKISEKKKLSANTPTSPNKTKNKNKDEKESKSKASFSDKKKKIKKSSKPTREGLEKQKSEGTSVKTASTASAKQSEESARERSKASSRERRASTRSRCRTGRTNPPNNDLVVDQVVRQVEDAQKIGKKKSTKTMTMPIQQTPSQIESYHRQSKNVDPGLQAERSQPQHKLTSRLYPHHRLHRRIPSKLHCS